MPTLRPGCLALGDPGFTNDAPVEWDMSVEVVGMVKVEPEELKDLAPSM